jgi:hypothetical protein
VLTDYTTGPLLTVNPFILSHGHGIERVSLRIQLFDAVAFIHRTGLVTCHSHRERPHLYFVIGHRKARLARTLMPPKTARAPKNKYSIPPGDI